MGVNVNVRILCVCVVLFMAIEAMGVHQTAPMDQFLDMGIRTLGKPKNKYKK
uniref:Transmembrane protein n=1 Tax=Medicago truncatula TaxID=3880 RepID=A2Q3A9_MEDTR|nr:hypothetical protein MtrDRAFT_AC155880g6v2 [Medicago truncatula]